MLNLKGQNWDLPSQGPVRKKGSYSLEMFTGDKQLQQCQGARWVTVSECRFPGPAPRQSGKGLRRVPFSNGVRDHSDLFQTARRNSEPDLWGPSWFPACFSFVQVDALGLDPRVIPLALRRSPCSTAPPCTCVPACQHCHEGMLPGATAGSLK